MSGFRWIVNPGDFRDVIVCSGRFDASDVHASIPGSRLYRFSSVLMMSGRMKCWEEFRDGMWSQTNRDNLPIKVLEAGEK